MDCSSMSSFLLECLIISWQKTFKRSCIFCWYSYAHAHRKSCFWCRSLTGAFCEACLLRHQHLAIFSCDLSFACLCFRGHMQQWCCSFTWLLLHCLAFVVRNCGVTYHWAGAFYYFLFCFTIYLASKQAWHYRAVLKCLNILHDWAALTPVLPCNIYPCFHLLESFRVLYGLSLWMQIVLERMQLNVPV